MRIISGKYNRRTLKAPKGLNTRPTSDKVKESLFNILSFKVNDSICLDMFAGSGNLGLEALSRNAKKVIFIDYDKNAIFAIKENIEALKIPKDDYLIIHDDYHVIKKLDLSFDIIFVDPPYRYEIIDELLLLVKKHDLLNKDGIIVYESDRVVNLDSKDYTIKTYKYGDTILNILYKI